MAGSDHITRGRHGQRAQATVGLQADLAAVCVWAMQPRCQRGWWAVAARGRQHGATAAAWSDIDKVCRHRLGEFKESETPAPVGPSLPNFCILAIVHRASSQQPATQEKRRHRGLWD